jgi:hypothetical protein
MKHLLLSLLIAAALSCVLPPASAAASDDDAVERVLYPRWRGNTESLGKATAEKIDFLATHHVNFIRYHVNLDAHIVEFRDRIKAEGRKPAAPTPENPLAPYELHFARLDALLPVLRRHGIQIILTASALYGGKQGDVFFETDKNDNNPHLPEFWRGVSKRYRREPLIVGYCIKNEPNYRDPAQAKKIWWDDLLPNSIKAIRENDKKVWLVLESPPTGALAWGFAQIPAIDDPRVIYALHHYMPHAYTHQGVRGLQKRGPDTRGAYTYPGESPRFDGGKVVSWDKAAVERTLHEVFQFQKRKPGVRIFVSEFGVARWAPGGAQWLADAIEIFERHGWDWTYHSFGGWSGWDPTYEADDDLRSRPDPTQDIKNTDRFQVVKAGWSLNARN